jgi:hypothetical protein
MPNMNQNWVDFIAGKAPLNTRNPKLFGLGVIGAGDGI